METRKVQITGGSTYVISLPKTWAKEIGIKQNDTLGFIPQHDGTMLITPKIVKGREERKKVFEYGKDAEPEKLLRDLIGAYMMGYDNVEVNSKPRMPPELRATVRRFTQMVIGPEIVDESIKSVVTKDLLDPTDLSFNSSLRRMYRIVEEMHRSAMLALHDFDAKLARDVISRDGDVDRLNWLVARQYNMLIRDIRLAESMDTTRERAINYLLIARILERIGDHGARIAENVERVCETKGSKKLLKEIGSLSERSMELLAKSMTSLFKKDSGQSNSTIDEVNSFIEACDRFENKLMSEKGGNVITLSNIIESIRRVSFYSRDISESVINFLVDIEGD